MDVENWVTPFSSTLAQWPCEWSDGKDQKSPWANLIKPLFLKRLPRAKDDAVAPNRAKNCLVDKANKSIHSNKGKGTCSQLSTVFGLEFICKCISSEKEVKLDDMIWADKLG